MSTQLFIVQLTYVKPIEEIDKLMKDHVVFLKKYYKLKLFMVSGRQVPRKGGVIICYAPTLKDVKDIMEEDPFKINKAARYKIIPFLCSMHSTAFGSMLQEWNRS